MRHGARRDWTGGNEDAVPAAGLVAERRRRRLRARRPRRAAWVLALLSGVLVLSPSANAATPVYQSQFGTAGSANGQFDTPGQIAVDPNTGDVYVADTNNNRIEEFDAAGNYLSQFGSLGSGNGQFEAPLAVAVDPSNGDVYVADTNNDRVQEFDSAGNYLSQFGSSGTGDGQFTGPTGVAVDPSSRDVYVVDGTDDRVEVFDSAGDYLSQFGATGTANGQFQTPLGIAVDPSSGDVYVTDVGNARVQRFDAAGNYLSQFGGAGAGNGQFEAPAGLAVDSSGDVYVGDFFNNRVQEFDSSGNYLAQFGVTGTGDGQFDGAFGVALAPSGGGVYVVDSGNDRVEVFGSAPAAPPAPAITSPTSGATPTFGALVVSGTASPGATVTLLDGSTPVGSTTADPVTGAWSITPTGAGAGAHSYSATQTVAGVTSPASGAVGVTVVPAAPTLTWATPAAITYGTALSATELDAGATGVTGQPLAGTFSYSPAAGAVPPAGSDVLTVQFTPEDATDYTSATGQVTLVVNRANSSLSVAPFLRFGFPFGFRPISATLTSLGQPLVGESVTFGTRWARLCVATTNAAGTATCRGSLLNLVRVLLGGGYTATFAGDANHLGASATAPLF